MSKQIVISGNRILAHGEDCFLAMGGTVICPDTGKVYQNATVATVDALPSDIDSVGYEYHADEFVPCAPYGIGSGNVAVFCGEDCKALKDSGIPMGNFSRYQIATYTGSGTVGINYCRYTFDFPPKLVLFIPNGSSLDADVSWGAIALPEENTTHYGVSTVVYKNIYAPEYAGSNLMQGYRTGNTLIWGATYGSSLTYPGMMFNTSGTNYLMIAFG